MSGGEKLAVGKESLMTQDLPPYSGIEMVQFGKGANFSPISAEHVRSGQITLLGDDLLAKLSVGGELLNLVFRKDIVTGTVKIGLPTSGQQNREIQILCRNESGETRWSDFVNQRHWSTTLRVVIPTKLDL